MELHKLDKEELQELIELYIKERDTFPWLISLEEFAKDYVVKCDFCGEMFVTDMEEKTCSACIEYLEQENKQNDDNEWQYFEDNKDFILHGIS